MTMTIRWGPRSTGGIVRAGHGGWSLTLGLPPTLTFQDPTTGDAHSIVGWRLWRARRVITDHMQLRAAERSYAIVSAASSFGLSRAPGESDEDLLARLRRKMSEPGSSWGSSR